MWKETDQDGPIPVSNYTGNFTLEKDKGKLKDFNWEISQYVHEKITQNLAKYPLCSYVFCPSKKCYVVIKNFIDNTNVYECLVFDPKAGALTESKELQLAYEELSQFINVCVQVQQTSADSPKCYSNFKVDINEKILDVVLPLLNQAFN